MESLTEVFKAFATKLLELLPRSPFQEFLDEFGELEFLGWLNWFFPVGSCLKVVVAWLTAIGLFYLYSIVLRWLKAIA